MALCAFSLIPDTLNYMYQVLLYYITYYTPHPASHTSMTPSTMWYVSCEAGIGRYSIGLGLRSDGTVASGSCTLRSERQHGMRGLCGQGGGE
eukprot:256342-Chlamydomonas_euryale.AAC.1